MQHFVFTGDKYARLAIIHENSYIWGLEDGSVDLSVCSTSMQT